MDGLKFYSMFDMPQGNKHFPGLDLEKDFPGMKQVVAGSIEYVTYEACTSAAVQFLKSKLAVLNAKEERYKIFFEKNQFDPQFGGDWSDNEIVKIYIADSLQTVYNSQFKARVFFVKDMTDLASYFDAPSTLQ
jgi:hypothetical protein